MSTNAFDTGHKVKQLKASHRPRNLVWALSLALAFVVCFAISARAQGAKQTEPGSPIQEKDADHAKERDSWFMRGRGVRGESAAELRRRAYQAKIRMRAERLAPIHSAASGANAIPILSTGSWTPLGPVPLVSDATGTGLQDYHQVAGRATAIAIDPADPTGNTVYVGGAQGGVWKSTNSANANALNVTWIPLTDDQATLSTGSIAIQPGNTDPTKSLILVGTGEADNSGDSYFGLGILRSVDAGKTWELSGTANGAALSFGGLGVTHLAFNTTSGQTNTVVAAMATTSEGLIDGAVTSNTSRGLYTSTDAGSTWRYNALLDGGQATDATSSTAVVYNAMAGQFFAAVRYHGFYSSTDGSTWTRLANQPGGALLNTSACPPQSTSNSSSCPIYRAEITVVPGRNEMYAWFVSFDSNGNSLDRGIWQTINGGASWTQISDDGIANCGDSSGCGVQQGFYNLELLAVPNGGAATDLYAGAINIYKCSISAVNPWCVSSPFINLTHVYGCDPLSALAHVHPDQHALAYMIPNAGSDSGSDLMYFANDGGIYRALDGFTGLNAEACSGANQFDDLNQNLGSMTQFVSFSQHPSDPATLLGGTQDNGSPATKVAGTNTGWIHNVLGGDGGYNAIDLNAPLSWFASNPDVGGGSLNILECPSGVNCNNSSFTSVVGSSSVGGDDGGFYFPYILDSQSTTALLVGTCRVWRGPRLGGTYTVLSPNFDTFGSGTCTGSEVNLVRSLAAGGAKDANGFSNVIYATTDGLGPIDGPLTSPAGGHVWVTTNAAGGSTTFADVTNNGPAGNINPNQFPISSVTIDPSDSSGNTAYVTIMGFTDGTSHVWQTTDAGGTWTDFSGTDPNALPKAPANAVVVDGNTHTVYVGTDVGVFQSSTVNASWTEVGLASGISGILPNVAVTALGIFDSGGEKLLRASTYGRGLWQLDLLATPDFQIAISDTPQTIFPTQTVTFHGTLTGLNGYTSSVALTCTAILPAKPPGTCAINPNNPIITPANPTVTFTVTASDPGSPKDFNFSVHAVGSNTGNTTHDAALTLRLVNFGLTTPSPSTVTVPDGTTSAPVTFQITAAGSFNQSVLVTCTTNLSGGSCTLTPAPTVNPTSTAPVTMTASVAVPASTVAGNYPVNIEATTASAPAPLASSFTLAVTSNPDFVLEPFTFPEVNAGNSHTSGSINIASQDGFSGTVSLSCSFPSPGSCSVSPASVNSFPATVMVTVDATNVSAGAYQLSVKGASGSTTHVLAVPVNVGDYSLSGTQTLSVVPGAQATANLTISSLDFYSGKVNATCDASALSGTICTLSFTSPITVSAGAVVPVTVTIRILNNASPGTYNVHINTQDTSGTPTHNLTIATTVGQDFTITPPNPSTQTVTAGQKTGAYNFNILPVGASFTNAVKLTCSGLPTLAQCIFTPPSPVRTGNVVLTISTAPASGSSPGPHPNRSILYTIGLGPALMLVGRTLAGRNRKVSALAVIVGSLVLVTILLPSCGGGIGSGGSGGGGGGGGGEGTHYTVTVTGTSGSPGTSGFLTHSTTVGLIVK